MYLIRGIQIKWTQKEDKLYHRSKKILSVFQTIRHLLNVIGILSQIIVSYLVESACKAKNPAGTSMGFKHAPFRTIITDKDFTLVVTSTSDRFINCFF